MIERFDALGIEKGALLPIVSPEVYMPQANEDILEMVEQYPDRFFAFCNIDPRIICNSPFAPIGDVLRHYKDKGCKGLGLKDKLCGIGSGLKDKVGGCFSKLRSMGKRSCAAPACDLGCGAPACGGCN